MSPLEVVQRYQAARVRVVLGDEAASAEATGGGLATTVEREGLGRLLGLFYARPALRTVELEDGAAALRLDRAGERARMQLRWVSGESLTQELLIEPHPEIRADFAGPRFRPAPDSVVTDLAAAIADPSCALYAVEGEPGWYTQGQHGDGQTARPLRAWIGPTPPAGPAWFRERYGLRANIIAGAMAGGIGSAEIVIEMGKAGYIGFFGSGGLGVEAVERAIVQVRAALGDRPAGYNLLHNPVEPAVEEATVDLYLKHGCRFVSASAFMGLTPAVVRYRYTGIHRVGDQIVCPNHVFAKVSRPEVAVHFLRPPPGELLDELVSRGGLSAQEADLARLYPMADAITAEADSGGHTDRRPLPVLVPMLRAQRDRVAAELGYSSVGARVAVGAAGGIGTPSALRAAFALGADYVLTGSINQASVEAGTSKIAKGMLAEATLADTTMAPAPDMFEIGAEVQVLQRGTMYAGRARRLYEIYRGFKAWEEVPEAERQKVEKQMLKRSFEEVWQDCERYWGERDPKQLRRAETDSRHRMALVFRWYLGMTSRWARIGEEDRKRDFQIWSGPAIAAFNDWVRGTSLEPLEARGVVAINEALLRGAAALERAERLAAFGLSLPEGIGQWRPS